MSLPWGLKIVSLGGIFSIFVLSAVSVAWVSLLTENLSPTGSWQALVTSGPACCWLLQLLRLGPLRWNPSSAVRESQGRAGPRKLGAYSGSNVQDINSLLMTAHESKHM